MPLVVEDGTGLSTSNSYVTLAEFKAYHDDRGNDYSACSDAQIQSALIRSSDYIEARWRRRFKGRRLAGDQALSFPRVGLFDDEFRLVEGIPETLKRAQHEYAFRALTTKLLPDPTTDATGLRVRRSRRKVGPIDTEIEYQQDASQLLKPYPAADRLLRAFVIAPGEVVRS